MSETRSSRSLDSNKTALITKSSSCKTIRQREQDNINNCLGAEMEGIRLKGMMEKFSNKVERMAAMVDDKTLISQLIREHSPRIDLIEFKDARADIWQHFRLVQLDGQTLAYAVCVRCLKPVSYKAREGTGGLHRHPCSKQAAVNNSISMTTLGALAYFTGSKAPGVTGAINSGVNGGIGGGVNGGIGSESSGNVNSRISEESSLKASSNGSSPHSSISPSSSPPAGNVPLALMSSSMSSSSSTSSSSSRNGHHHNHHQNGNHSHLHHSLSYPIQNSPLSLTTNNKSGNSRSGSGGNSSRKSSSSLNHGSSPEGSTSSSSSGINNSLNNLSSIMTNSFGIKNNGNTTMTTSSHSSSAIGNNSQHNSNMMNGNLVGNGSSFNFSFANGSLKSDCHAMILLNDAHCPSLHPVTEPMTDLFERKVLLDLTLTAKNGSIKVHKVALAAASSVLEEALSGSPVHQSHEDDDDHDNEYPDDLSAKNGHSMKLEDPDEEVEMDLSDPSSRRKKEAEEKNEQRTNVTELDMTDFDVSSVQALAEFIYYGELNDSELLMTEVMKIAELYDLKALKFACAQRLYRSLTPENAIEYLALAESCNCEQLKQLIPCFIAENAAKVTSTDAWKETFKDRSDLVANLLAVTATDLSMSGSNGSKKRKTSF